MEELLAFCLSIKLARQKSLSLMRDREIVPADNIRKWIKLNPISDIMITVLYIALHICFAVNAQSGSMPLKGTDLDIVLLRFEAQQCHLRAIRSKELEEIERLHILGNRLSALADEVEGAAIAEKRG